MTKHRNVCAHGDRFYNYKTKDSIADTIVHKKLNLPKSNGRYELGKNETALGILINPFWKYDRKTSGFNYDPEVLFYIQ